jgi:hypothetical protein
MTQMTRYRSPTRRSFFESSFSALLVSAATLGFESPAIAGGARSGPWCRELTKTARDETYDFSLYLLDGDGTVFTLSDHIGRPVWLQFFASWARRATTKLRKS